MDIFQKALQETQGREADLLVTLGRIDSDLLDGRHHPCPKCGGDDRFRFVQDKGSLFCNQCFRTSKADLVSSLSWLLDVKRNEAAGMLLDHLGVKFKRPKQLHDFITLEPWRPNCDVVGEIWAEGKRVTLDAMKAAGVTWAKHKRDKGVLAFPIYGEDQKICGWSMYNRGWRGKLERRRGKGKPVEYLKVKACDGSTAGMLGQVSQVDVAETVVICEGGTDMLAAIASGYVAVSPSNGASQKLPPWFCKLLAGKQVVVIADRDHAGRDASQAWSQQAAGQAASVKAVELPYELVESKGKDLRDFLQDHPGGLQALIDATPAYEPQVDAEGQVIVPEVVEDDVTAYRALQIDVIQRLNQSGATLYCRKNKNTQDLSVIDQLTIPTLITLCGIGCMNYVKKQGEDRADKISIYQVREFLADEISKVGFDGTKICGPGIWQADDGTILFVNGTHSIVFDGKPRITEEGMYRDLRSRYTRQDWCDSDRLLENYEASSDQSWRCDRVAELAEFLDHWTWDHKMCPYLLSGLIMATMVQSCISWRPLVSVLGESNSGKTVLITFLSRLMGENYMVVHDSTAAGIRSRVGSRHSSAWLMYDEWDRSKYQSQILDLVRCSTRKSGMQMEVLKSNSSQKSLSFYQLPLLLWCFGIHNAVEDEADLNRVIEIKMMKPEKDKDLAFRNKNINSIALEGEYARDLGCKIMAIAIRILEAAQRLYEPLSNVTLDGVPARVVESLAVPAAFLAASWGRDQATGERLLEDFREMFVREDAIEIATDYERLLDDLFSSQVDLGHGIKKQLSYLLSGFSDSQSNARGGYETEMQGQGVKLTSHAGVDYLFISGKYMHRNRVSKESPRSIMQILRRVPGAKGNVMRRLGGHVTKGVLIPIAIVRDFVPDVWVDGITDESDQVDEF